MPTVNPENLKKLQHSLERSKQLIKTTSTPEFDRYAKQLNNGSLISENESFTPTLSTIPSKNSAEYALKSSNNMATSPNINKKLPKAILESIVSNPISQEQNNIDELDALFTNSAPATQIHEQKRASMPGFSSYLNESTQTSQSSQIDYSLIKMIVKECVNEALEKYLNENDNIKIIKFSDNIRFLTKNGSLYEGKLDYKGNVNQSKK